MLYITPNTIRRHIKQLQKHLSRENPILLEAVKSFRTLDRVCYNMGLFDRNHSLTTQVPWWPMIAILGTFSSGKSTFINSLLGQDIQKTGNQAVDDKFTVICHTNEPTNHVLPGRSLDADPRFPFFQISDQIESVAKGEGSRIDAYLQLKTSNSPIVKGKILIDSPGFDADHQRNSTLRIVSRIMDLSDLVLVFFDARHPEPGAMQDTLEHLVARTINRSDSSKFLYVLNQIDNAAREDNPEEVFGAWQRSLAQKGLTAGKFYRIYDLESAIPIEDEQIKERFEQKRAEDMEELNQRIQGVEVERAYRIIGLLEQTANSLRTQIIPIIKQQRIRWRRLSSWIEGIVFAVLGLIFLWWSIGQGYWDGLTFSHPYMAQLTQSNFGWVLFLGGLIAIGFSIHQGIRHVTGEWVMNRLDTSQLDPEKASWVRNGLAKNIRSWYTFGNQPVGAGRATNNRIAKVLSNADQYIQELNNRFADPSGKKKRIIPPPSDQSPRETTRAAEAATDVGLGNQDSELSSNQR